MNHTKNYGLPQWELNDLIRMEDFNGAMNNIETGLDSSTAKAEAAVNTANFAKAAAIAAQNKANELPYAAGSYVGTGKDVDIHLGFRPSFVIVCGHLSGGALGTDMMMTFVFSATAGNVVPLRIAFMDNGFRACAPASGNPYPDFSVSGRRYDYIAFK